MLHSSRLRVFILVFSAPGLSVDISHANHRRGGPRKRKQSSKGNKESQAFPSHRKAVWSKSYSGVATSRKDDGCHNIIHEAQHY